MVGGYPPGPGLVGGGGFPPTRPGWWGVLPPPPPGLDGVPPPLIRQSSIASTCYPAGGMPLAFTQEDFLVPYLI